MAKGFKTGGRELGTPNKTTSELRKVLKHMVDDELQNIQDNINELEPKERIELLIKLLPYVMPKVQTVSPRDGEPIGLDWINEF